MGTSGRRGPGLVGQAPRDFAWLDELPVDPGLCTRCVHVRVLRSPSSTFVRCAMAEVVPDRFTRYPPLPVLACEGFEKR